MKSLLFALLVLFVSFDCWADKESHARAKRYGATATFRLTVVDDQGKPVPNVKGSAGFWNHRTHTTDSFSSTSNEKGEITLSGRCFYDGAFGLEKEGYYKTTGRHKFSRASDDDVEETLFTRKWIPDYVSTEVLKRKRNPIPMIARRVSVKVPQLDTPVGFDLEVMDWVKPHGKGKTLDMYITLQSKEVVISPTRRWVEIGKITFTFPNSRDGVQMCNLEGWSDFMSTYHVNLNNAFKSEIVLTPSPNERDLFLYGKSYLVFRVRGKLSSSGKLIRCNYGKMYPMISTNTKQLNFAAIYFNPTQNDTNLEFDPNQNLAPFSNFEEEQQIYHLRP